MRVGGIAFSRFWCSLVGLEVERAFLWRERRAADSRVFPFALDCRVAPAPEGNPLRPLPGRLDLAFRRE